MAFNKFEDLIVWQRSCRLAVTILNQVKLTKHYGFKDQIINCSVSIPSNIAEGAERGSLREFLQFLRYAKGSSGELKTQLYLAFELDIISIDDRNKHLQEVNEISAMLAGLIKRLKRIDSQARHKT